MRSYKNLPGILLFVFLFLIPLIITLSSIDSETLKNTVLSTTNRKILLFTIFQALTATLLSLVVGLPGAFIMAKCRFKGKKILQSLYTIPFVLPSVLTVLGFVMFYGNNGFLNRVLHIPIRLLYSFRGIMAAEVFYNFPIVITLVQNAIMNLDPGCEENAKTEGCSKFQIATRIIIPRLLPSVFSASCLIFLYCCNSFSIITVLGGSPSFTTTEVEIYRQARISLNIPQASALSLISLAIKVPALILTGLSKRDPSNENITYSTQNAGKDRISFLQILYLAVTSIFIAGPILSIFTRAVSSGAFATILGKNRTIDNGILQTLLIACSSSLLATYLGTSMSFRLAEKKHSVLLDALSMGPTAVSSIIVGLGWFTISKYVKGLNSTLLVILAHAVISTPFAIRTVLPDVKQLPKQLEESAATDGANAGTINLRIKLPAIKSALLSSLVFTFAISAGELNSTIMLGGKPTVSVQIYSLINAYRYDSACALGILLLLVCFAVFAIINALRFYQNGDSSHSRFHHVKVQHVRTQDPSQR